MNSNKVDTWSSLLDSVASGKCLPDKRLLVLGGSTQTQKDFLEVLASDSPKNMPDRKKKRPPIANDFALGYTYQDVLEADHEGSSFSDVGESFDSQPQTLSPDCRYIPCRTSPPGSHLC